MNNQDFENLKIIASGRKSILDEAIADRVISVLCNLYGIPEGYDEIEGVRYERNRIGGENIYKKGVYFPGKPLNILKKFPDTSLTQDEIYIALLKLSFKYISKEFNRLLDTFRGSLVYERFRDEIRSSYKEIA